ncbi:hypothetical protein GCM10007276_32360 [Agaricicola taiwanensis]|uniref:Ankyrin repeat domain-containing protein n=2 Tax=Agaricicola taiwanensis TaxID=591372 RepID=A0A8J3DY76_9RHOB|nr:hypothetical protein GCM10007276_32360 [Agaricicola taiwanensis]
MVAALRAGELRLPTGEDAEGLFGLQIKASTGRQGTAAEIQLRDALKSGNMQLAVQIINSGTVDINWVDSQNGWSFLHYAVSTDGGLPAIEHLVKAGIDIRLTNDDGETAIEMFDTRYFAVLQENGYDLEYIKFATGAAKWISDKATEEIKKIAEGGMDKVGDFMEVNKWRAAGGSLIPIMTKVSLFDVLHLRPEDQVWFVKDILGNDGRVEEMIEKGEIDPEALMAEELNGETPYVFFQRMADNEEIAEADRTRFQEIADVLKAKGAPGSEETESGEGEGPAKVDFDKEDLDKLDILNMKTDVEVDGEKLTVSAATIKTMLEKYKKGIDDGDIKEGSAQWNYYHSLRALIAINSGSSVTPYFEGDLPGNTSERHESGAFEATAEDWQDIYDPEKVKKMFQEASADEQVGKDIKAAQDEALGKVPGLDKDAIKAAFEKPETMEGLRQYIAGLSAAGKIEEAQAEAQRALSAYAAVASQEEVDEYAQKLAVNDMASMLDEIMANPEGISDEYWEKATADWAAMMLEMANRGLQLGRHGMNVLNAQVKDFYQSILDDKNVRNAVAQIMKATAASGGVPSNKSLVQAFDKLVEDGKIKHIPLPQRDTILKGLNELNNMGAFSTGIGLISLVSGIYQQTAGRAFDDNHLQNMQIARSYLLFFGTMPEIFKLGSQFTKTSLAKFMGMGDTSAIFGAKSVRDIFEVSITEGDKMDDLLKFLNDLPGATPSDAPEPPKGFKDKVAKLFGGEAARTGKFAAKVMASIGKVVGATAFTGFGIVDAVLGGFTAKEGADKGDDILLAQGILQVFTGTFTTAAGAAMGFAAAGFAAASALISPLLLAAAVIGVVVILIDVIRSIFTEDDTASMGEFDFLKEQEKLGLLQGDGIDKFEFLRFAGYNGQVMEGDSWNPGEIPIEDRAFFMQQGGRRPYTPSGVSVFDAYDWKAWTKEYHDNRDAFYDDKVNLHFPTDHQTFDKPSDQDFENNLNAVVVLYNKGIKGVGGNRDSGGSVPGLGGELRDRIKTLMLYYYTNIDVSGTDAMAARWVAEQIEGRLGGTYSNSDDGAEGAKIFWRYFDVHSGKGDFEALAKEVYESR